MENWNRENFVEEGLSIYAWMIIIKFAWISFSYCYHMNELMMCMYSCIGNEKKQWETFVNSLSFKHSFLKQNVSFFFFMLSKIGRCFAWMTGMSLIDHWLWVGFHYKLMEKVRIRSKWIIHNMKMIWQEIYLNSM